MKRMTLLGSLMASFLCANAQWTTTATPNTVNVLTNGNVGIGYSTVTAPPEKLHLNGILRITGTTDIYTATAPTLTTGAIRIGSHGTTKGWIQSYGGSGTTFTPLLLNPKGGTVGIGASTTLPLSGMALQVNGTSLFKNKIILNGTVNQSTVTAPGTNDNLLTLIGGDIKIIENTDYSKMPDGKDANLILQDKSGGILNISQGNNIGSINIGGTSTELRIGQTFDRKTSVTIYPTGKMCIGAETTGAALSQPAGYMLYVKQGILTEKFKLAVSTDLVNWSDYVFAPDYKLSSLNEVEKFVRKNKHLPEVPSASDVYANGIDVAQMDATLLKKIEELTLHVIAQQKLIEDLQKRVK